MYIFILMETKVITRFAPSPTGNLHIGGARTALYNYLFAKHFGGKFRLRIEDTDTERSKQEYTDNIFEALEWLGLNWDDEVVYQSSNKDKYRTYVEKLLENGYAYKCFCSEDELNEKRLIAQKNKVPYKYDGKCRTLRHNNADAEKKYVIRFKQPDKPIEITLNDLLRGNITFSSKDLDDFILMRSNHEVTYNLAVVIDDTEMCITHIIRGDDHINNTPKQVMIYKALGFEIPQFAHLPMILGHDRKRLSKRHGALNILDYRDRGILPSALTNFIVRIGWAHGNDEIFTLNELIRLFSFKGVGKSSGTFNEEKLLWLSREHIKMLEPSKLKEFFKFYFTKTGFQSELLETKNLDVILEGLKGRSNTLIDLVTNGKYYFTKSLDIDKSLSNKHLTDDKIDLLFQLKSHILEISDFCAEEIEKTMDIYLKNKDLKLKDIAQPLRVALTGTKVSPGLFELMEGMGKELVIKRIEDLKS